MDNASRVCSFCVMDNSNPSIVFDANGQCNCCRDALNRKPHEWWTGPEGDIRMRRLIATLKEEGADKPYDAMVGLSGGIDSAFLAHLAARKHGLRLLAVHVDGGWNSEPAVHNIEILVRKLDLDLHTYVIDWQEMRDLQIAFMKASVLNQDIPQDHAFFSTLYRTAAKFGIRHFLSGVNFASESVIPRGFGYPSIDGTHASAIQKRFGSLKLTTYPFMSPLEYIWLTRVRRQLTIHRPLNYIDYNKEEARTELQREYGWRDYGGKHSESRFTKFYQDIYLPKKFNFDKRRLHLSSLIVAGQMTREEALREISTPIISVQDARRETKFVAKKLGLKPEELQSYIEAPPVPHSNFPNGMWLHKALLRLRKVTRILLPSRSATVEAADVD
ncbi:N-acetyl sugar amidotransferase [Rhizobium sp. MC63]|uniref:N-acetyl sugar amidotransferase n=1 Tax=Rhizobium mulingense TaxID=3031128 RepID=A0ACC6MVL4_9HYPH|nr:MULTISPECIES: N-acetyl sugar amidotransferase [unclassified Rhizobium]MDF0695201.1 N-acetyl sugar amidotransferase [Rhizobium sp. MC63]MEA3517435.1 N-acetyl sugar amidotransferase [Rhizobium sp. MJ31]MEB3045605.1 N-acetyl sugar amidotransferase [Rhizobium sp. MJ21]